MNKKEIELFLQGEFELDCPIIKLTPFLSSSKKETLSGSGIITINKNGYFDLKVFFPKSFSFKEIFENLTWDVGKIISEEFYYNLVAHDISGKSWIATRFILNRNSGQNGSIITGKIPTLHYKEEIQIDKKSQFQLFFNEPIKVPLNTFVREVTTVGEEMRGLKTSIKLAKFKACNIALEVEVTDGYSILSAVSEEHELSGVLVNRIFEALQFVIAYSEPWSMLVTKNNGVVEYKINAVKKKKLKSRILPPISYQNRSGNNSVWQLFEKYLTFIISNKTDFYHPISALLSSIIESGKASLDIEALTLSVSIEALLKKELGSHYSHNAVLEKNIECMKHLILESGQLDGDFRKRMLGTINSMKNPRAKDILFALSDNNLINTDLVKIYGKLRNKTAHGASNSGADIQNFFNQTGTILVLFYQLVFLIIKYKGKYTDYGTYQYPTKEFLSKLP